MGSFEQPSKDDFSRMLMSISEKARLKALEKENAIQSKMVSLGAVGNSRYPIILAREFLSTHQECVDEVMAFTAEFMGQSGIPLEELCDEVKGVLTRRIVVFSTPILRAMNVQSRPENQGVSASQRKPFETQIEEGIKNLKVGYVGTRRVTMKPADTVQGRALRLLEAIYEQTRSREEPVFIDQIAGQLGIYIDDARAAWRYLADKGLIQTFSVLYTARISAKGVDAIEEAQLRPNQPTPTFPSVTYNVTIQGTGTGSQVNVGTTASTQMTQVSNLDPGAVQKLAEGVGDLIEQIRVGLPSIPAALQPMVTAVVADLSDAAEKKEPTRLQSGLESLGRILEGAAGNLLAIGAQAMIRTLLGLPPTGS
jgi:hypothetical protein